MRESLMDWRCLLLLRGELLSLLLQLLYRVGVGLDVASVCLDLLLIVLASAVIYADLAIYTYDALAVTGDLLVPVTLALLLLLNLLVLDLVGLVGAALLVWSTR